MTNLEDKLRKAEEENNQLKEKITKAKEAIAKTQEEILALKETKEEYQQKLENLLAPPLIHAFFLGEAQHVLSGKPLEGEQKSEEKQYIILHMGNRMLVNASPELDMEKLIQEEKVVLGQYVLVNADAPHIIHIGEYPAQGVVGRIHEILSDEKYVVETHHDEKIVAIKGHHAPSHLQIGDDILFTEGIILSQIARTERKRTLEVISVDKTFAEIGALDEVKENLLSLFQDKIMHPEILAQYGRTMPKGILLHGPPGCGKTTIAKAIMSQLGQSFDGLLKQNHHLIKLRKGLEEKNSQAHEQVQELQKTYQDMFPTTSTGEFIDALLLARKIDCTNIQQEEQRLERLLAQEKKTICMYADPSKALNMWLGEGERFVREMFSELRDSAREYGFAAVILDEAESILRTRGTSYGTQAYDSLVNTFCREIDGMISSNNIMIFLLTNRHDLIDPAILRHGRIDLKFHVKRPETLEDAKKVFAVYLNDKTPLDITEINKYGSKEKVREAFINRAVQELFTENKSTWIGDFVLENGEREPMYFKHVVSGALIEAVVKQAKDYAIDRFIAYKKGKSTDTRQLCEEDLVRAVQRIYEEEKFVPRGTNQEEWGRTLGESRKIAPRTQKHRERGGRNYL